MSDWKSDPDLMVALEAARSGAEIIKKYQDRRLQIDYKGKFNLVTDADVATEKEIVRIIREAFPEDRFLAEESASEHTLGSDRTWIIDPIDGTTNFAYGFPVYCVSVALYVEGRAQAGVVIEVNRDEEYVALKGGGAWLNGDRITVSELEEPEQAVLATGFPYERSGLMNDYYRLFQTLNEEVQGVRRPGAAAWDLCCVAAGRFQGFYEYALKAWDVAAGALLIEEAGGVVSDWKGGDDWLLGERIIAGNASIHRYLKRRIGEVIPAWGLTRPSE